MLIIPAIDLKDGHCVRLKQGLMEDATVFSEDPGAMARHWADQGGKRLHLVDLNGAFAGKPVNEGAIKAIVQACGGEIPIQLGGGIRDLETIERYLDNGIDYVIIGTAAVKNPVFLHDACSAFPGQIINIHPALLPKYGGKGMYGHHVHEAVKAAGESETGITIHQVDEKYDHGTYIFQAVTTVSPDDTPETIAKKVHQLEHQFYPRVIRDILNQTPRG
jgi:imidazole glycerol phosphate synthase subunit HisF